MGHIFALHFADVPRSLPLVVLTVASALPTAPSPVLHVKQPLSLFFFFFAFMSTLAAKAVHRLQTTASHLSRASSSSASSSALSKMATEYKTRVVGAQNTLEHRVFIEDKSGKVVSPFQ